MFRSSATLPFPARSNTLPSLFGNPVRACAHNSLKQQSSRLKFGVLHPCNQCQEKFRVVRCPYPHCQKYSIKPKSDNPGQLIKCDSCLGAFSQIACSCGKPVSYPPEQKLFEGYTKITCECQNSFKFFNCIDCSHYNTISPDASLGTPLRCEGCLKAGQLLYCPVPCLKRIDCKKFQYGESYNCKECKRKFDYCICCSCAKLIYSSNQQNSGCMKKCYNPQCQSKFIFAACPKCREYVYLTSFARGNVYEQKCPSLSCASDIIINYCLDCEKVHVGSDPTCPEKAAKELDKKGYGQKMMCVVCLDNVRCIINTKCFHVSMCETCLESMAKSNKTECPVCREKQGKFQKAFFC